MKLKLLNTLKTVPNLLVPRMMFVLACGVLIFLGWKAKALTNEIDQVQTQIAKQHPRDIMDL